MPPAFSKVNLQPTANQLFSIMNKPNYFLSLPLLGNDNFISENFEFKQIRASLRARVCVGVRVSIRAENLAENRPTLYRKLNSIVLYLYGDSCFLLSQL